MRVGEVRWWRSWRCGFVAVLLAGASLLALLPLSAVSAGSVRGIAAKTKPKPCQKGTIPVTVQRKRSCTALSRAFPKPREGDTRLSFLKAVLGSSALNGVRDRRGRSAPSVRQMFRGRARPARAALVRALPKVLARLDSLARAPAVAARLGGLSRRGGAHAAASDTVTFDIGDGHSVDISANPESPTATIALSSPGSDGGKVVFKARIGTTNRGRDGGYARVGYSRIKCPTVDGVVDVMFDLELSATTEEFDADGDLVSYNEDTLSEHAVLRGQTADDGKLDFVDLTDEIRIQEKDGGSILGTVALDVRSQHRTRINMRTGQYVPSLSSANVAGRLTGVLRIFQSRYTSKATARAQARVNDSFAKTVRDTIDHFRFVEDWWNTPGKCVDTRLDPRSGDLILSAGDTGRLNAQAQATDGGKAIPTASWTVIGQQNATFTPTNASANPIDFSYATTSAGPGISVTATFRSVSKRGVGEATWTQPTKEPADPPTLSGTIGGHVSLDDGGSPISITWAGSVDLVRRPTQAGTATVYDLKSLTLTAVDYLGDVGSCLFMGRDTPTITAGPAPGMAGVMVVEPGASPTYRIGLQVTSASINGVLSVCAQPSLNGTPHSFDLTGLLLLNTPTPQCSASRFGFGPANLMGSTSEYEWTWLLGDAARAGTCA